MRYILIWIMIMMTHVSCSQARMKTFNYNSSLWKSTEEIDEIKQKNKAFIFKCTKVSHPLIQSPSMIQGSSAVFKLTGKEQSLPAGMGNAICIKFDKFNIAFNKGVIYHAYISKEGSLLYIEENK